MALREDGQKWAGSKRVVSVHVNERSLSRPRLRSASSNGSDVDQDDPTAALLECSSKSAQRLIPVTQGRRYQRTFMRRNGTPLL